MQYTIISIVSLLAAQAIARPVSPPPAPPGPTISWKGPTGVGCALNIIRSDCTDLFGNSAHLGLGGIGVDLSMLPVQDYIIRVLTSHDL